MSSMSMVPVAFMRGARDLARRDILKHALWPPLLSLVVWSGIAMLLWAPASVALAAALPDWSWLTSSWLGSWLISALLLMALAPLVYFTSLLLMSAFALPGMMALVAARDYPELVRAGSNVVWGSIANSLLAGLFYLGGWLATLPLLLIPGVLMVLPMAWTAWLNQRTFCFDALAEHASADERRRVIARIRPQRYAAGVGTTLLVYVPLLNLLAPAWSALVFVHLCLDALRRLRSEEAV